MTKEQITKVVDKSKKMKAENDEYSIGFCRFVALPKRVVKNVNIALVIRGESNHESIKQLFNSMDEFEFKNWLHFQ
jgi:hypothetical protein